MDSEKRTNTRRENAIKKYGSWEAYEKNRAIKSRQTALAKCTTQEQLEQKQRDFAFIDFIKQNYDSAKIGKPCDCIDCGESFIGNARQQVLCRSCFLTRRKIAKYGDLVTAHKKIKEKQKAVLLEKYGDENYNNRKKSHSTSVGKYGEDYYKQRAKKTKQTKQDKYGDSNYNNKQQIIKTNLERYGVSSTGKLDWVIDKRLQTLEDNPEIMKQATEKRVATMRERDALDGSGYQAVLSKVRQTMGGKAPIQCPELKQKIQQTNREKYGCENPMQNLAVQEKSMTTKLEKYGTVAPLRSLYFYDDSYFDSSWELAYYVYLKDSDIPFVYKPKPLLYKDTEGRNHQYFPDFLVGNSYVEIKGDHLIDSDGVLKNFRGKRLLEKTRCLVQNNVKVLTSRDLLVIIGPNFTKDLHAYKVPLNHKRLQNDKSK